MCCERTAAETPQAQIPLCRFGKFTASDKLCHMHRCIPACLEPRMHLQETSQCMSLQSSPPEVTAAETCWDIHSLLQQWLCLSRTHNKTEAISICGTETCCRHSLCNNFELRQTPKPTAYTITVHLILSTQLLQNAKADLDFVCAVETAHCYIYCRVCHAVFGNHRFGSWGL